MAKTTMEELDFFFFMRIVYVLGCKNYLLIMTSCLREDFFFFFFIMAFLNLLR